MKQSNFTALIAAVKDGETATAEQIAAMTKKQLGEFNATIRAMKATADTEPDTTEPEHTEPDTTTATTEPTTKTTTCGEVRKTATALRTAYNDLRAEILSPKAFLTLAVKAAKQGTAAEGETETAGTIGKAISLINAIGNAIGSPIDLERYSVDKVIKYLWNLINRYAPYRFAPAEGENVGRICTLRAIRNVRIMRKGIASEETVYIAVPTNGLQMLLDAYKAVKYGVTPQTDLIPEISGDKDDPVYTYYSADLAKLSNAEKLGMPHRLNPHSPQACTQIRHFILTGKYDRATTAADKAKQRVDDIADIAATAATHTN